MSTTKLPRAAAPAFTLITETGETTFDRASYAVSRAMLERSFHGRSADVCGPAGWLFVDGKLLGDGEWELLEVGYDEGRGWLMLTGYNRNTGEMFTWGSFRGSKMQTERFGLQHARVTDERAVKCMQLAGFDVT